MRYLPRSANRSLAGPLQTARRIAFPGRGLPACPLPGEWGPVTVENDWWVRKDGSMIAIACTAVPFEAPGGYGVVVSFTDLTMRRTQRAGRSRAGGRPGPGR
jgi:hypothetical protein